MRRRFTIDVVDVLLGIGALLAYVTVGGLAVIGVGTVALRFWPTVDLWRDLGLAPGLGVTILLRGIITYAQRQVRRRGVQ
jgi:hypothetical protein